MTAIIEAINLNKTFKLGEMEVEVLKDINLSIDRGEFITIMGPSGSGKSTFLYLMGGLDRPTSGKINIDGKDISIMNDKEQSIMRRRAVGFVFQFYNLIPNLTVEDNVMLPILLDGKNIKDYNSNLKEILDIVELSDRKDHTPRELSGGQQQRVAIARALINDPDIIFADEPTGNLDSKTTEEVMKLLQKINKDKKKTIVQVSHSMETARYGSRIINVRDAEGALLDMFNVWRKEAIKVWAIDNGRYFNFSKIIAEKLHGLINSDPEEIIVMGSITTNIHQCLATFYRPSKEKYKIIVDELNFPTDIYAAKSIIELKGYNVDDVLIKVKSRDGRTINEEDIISKMTEDVALILLPSVLYRSAQLLDMEYLTREAHKRNILIGWDLAHSIGAVPHDFKKIDPDFAVWCSYKYLNAGPGATAGMYINKRHFDKAAGLKGWFGNKDESQFLMSHDFDQDKDANGWLLGTHNLFSMAPLDGVLNIFSEVGIQNIRIKSLHITAYLMYLIDTKLHKYGYSIGNPREDHRRGGHICLEHEEAYRISLALRDNNVIPDYREPNVIRLAPVALYVTYEDVYNLVGILEKIMVNKEFSKYSIDRVTVL